MWQRGSSVQSLPKFSGPSLLAYWCCSIGHQLKGLAITDNIGVHFNLWTECIEFFFHPMDMMQRHLFCSVLANVSIHIEQSDGDTLLACKGGTNVDE
jgi:hypothetical protein